MSEVNGLAQAVDEVKRTIRRNAFEAHWQSTQMERAYRQPEETPNGIRAYWVLRAVAKELGVPVRFIAEPLVPGSLGYFNRRNGVHILNGRSLTGQARTLAHELSHAVDKRYESSFQPVRDEVIAESSAVLVLKALGVEANEAAWYLAGSGASGDDVVRYADRTQEVSGEILRAINKVERREG